MFVYRVARTNKTWSGGWRITYVHALYSGHWGRGRLKALLQCLQEEEMTLSDLQDVSYKCCT